MKGNKWYWAKIPVYTTGNGIENRVVVFFNKHKQYFDKMKILKMRNKNCI